MNRNWLDTEGSVFPSRGLLYRAPSADAVGPLVVAISVALCAMAVLYGQIDESACTHVLDAMAIKREGWLAPLNQVGQSPIRTWLVAVSLPSASFLGLNFLFLIPLLSALAFLGFSFLNGRMLMGNGLGLLTVFCLAMNPSFLDAIRRADLDLVTAVVALVNLWAFFQQSEQDEGIDWRFIWVGAITFALLIGFTGVHVMVMPIIAMLYVSGRNAFVVHKRRRHWLGATGLKGGVLVVTVAILTAVPLFLFRREPSPKSPQSDAQTVASADELSSAKLDQPKPSETYFDRQDTLWYRLIHLLGRHHYLWVLASLPIGQCLAELLERNLQDRKLWFSVVGACTCAVSWIILAPATWLDLLLAFFLATLSAQSVAMIFLRRISDRTSMWLVTATLTVTALVLVLSMQLSNRAGTDLEHAPIGEFVESFLNRKHWSRIGLSLTSLVIAILIGFMAVRKGWHTQTIRRTLLFGIFSYLAIHAGLLKTCLFGSPLELDPTVRLYRLLKRTPMDEGLLVASAANRELAASVRLVSELVTQGKSEIVTGQARAEGRIRASRTTPTVLLWSVGRRPSPNWQILDTDWVAGYRRIGQIGPYYVYAVEDD